MEYRTPVKSELKVNPEGGDDSLVTLVHTVSFYRRQQSASNSPAVRASRPVTYNPANDVNESVEAETTESKNDEQIRVQEKVKSLLDEVCKQQQIISQASQALNLCAATIEFSGSTEAVEGERLLLVASTLILCELRNKFKSNKTFFQPIAVSQRLMKSNVSEMIVKSGRRGHQQNEDVLS